MTEAGEIFQLRIEEEIGESVGGASFIVNEGRFFVDSL